MHARDFPMYGLAVVLGVVVAWFDVAAPFGDDTAKVTVLLWLITSAILGWLRPCWAWRWAVLIGPWVSVIYAALHAAGRSRSLHPDTWTTISLLLLISLATCLLGAYAAAWAHHAIGAR